MATRSKRSKRGASRAKTPTTKPKTPNPDSFASEVMRELNKGDTATPAQLLGSDEKAIKIRGVISTQSVTLDRAIGRGGIPLGRTTMLHGWEGSGKTTLALHMVAEAQQRSGMAVYLDTEYKLDRDYAKGIGVDIDHLVVVQPPYLESALEKIALMIGVAKRYRKKGVVLPIIVVLDSIDSTKAKAVIDGSWEDQHIAPEPRVWSQKFPKLVPLLSNEDVALLLISQRREKIGVLFGKKDKPSGGHAPRFYSSLLMGIERISSIKHNDEVVGNETRVYIGKNQISPPFRSAEFRIMYGTGIDYEESLLRAALEAEVVERSGAWYAFDGERIGQGYENALATVRGNDSLVAKLKERL